MGVVSKFSELGGDGDRAPQSRLLWPMKDPLTLFETSGSVNQIMIPNLALVFVFYYTNQAWIIFPLFSEGKM